MLSHLQSLPSHQTLACIAAYDMSCDAESCSKQSLALLRTSSCGSCASHAQRRKREHASTSTFRPGLPQSSSNIRCITKGHLLGSVLADTLHSLRGRCMESALLTGRCSKSINRFSASFLGRVRAIPSRTVTCCSRFCSRLISGFDERTQTRPWMGTGPGALCCIKLQGMPDS